MTDDRTFDLFVDEQELLKSDAAAVAGTAASLAAHCSPEPHLPVRRFVRFGEADQLEVLDCRRVVLQTVLAQLASEALSEDTVEG